MIEQSLISAISTALSSLFGIDNASPQLEPTKEGFEGDFTLVVFPFLKASKKNPEETAKAIGEYLIQHNKEVAGYNVVKGFLNITLAPNIWIDWLESNAFNADFGKATKTTDERILVEYSSPNTNKPLHLGHIRNNLLGYSIAKILEANGHQVKTCNLINDRGIHICKSMLAWQKFGNGETPDSSGIKGDHLVGKYYVIFDKHYKEEINQLVAGGMDREVAEKKAPLIIEAQEMLKQWESGNEEVIKVWKMMNGWVYAGFDTTYKNLGVHFDTFYYESNTYLLGKELVQEGLNKNVFYKKDDGSVWIDLTNDGLDQKLLLRADGTSVYMTQDIGTAELKYADFNYNQSVYVVGNEQDYHFKVLKLICQKLNKPYANGIYHLSYGMVELPEGKMKSREGTVVDADDLISEMIQQAKETTIALGKTDGLSDVELENLYRTIGLGALKYFLLKVEPKKKMLFNPKESIDFQGNTGPFIQYTYARIKSILRNAMPDDQIKGNPELHPLEKELISHLNTFPQIVKDAGKEMSPAVIANYTYALAKSFSHFYHEVSILREADSLKRNFRLKLALMTSQVIQSGFNLLGINVPERM